MNATEHEVNPCDEAPDSYVFIKQRTGEIVTPKKAWDVNTKKSPVLAFVLNFVWPGLGHVYVGALSGIVGMLLWPLFMGAWYSFTALAIADANPNAPLFPFVTVVFLVFPWAYALLCGIEASRAVARINRGYPAEFSFSRRRHAKYGVVAIKNEAIERLEVT